ncbi:MAG TPA: GTP 3',8-cyclase MoaA [Deltaproteobacteria bacterium]|nr:GTP 3',8-cyclase MoaA [Deltaproteobacteria bacterium]
MSLPPRIEGLERPTDGALIDPYGRVHTYLRVSVTDRCNYRCTYCMPAAGLRWMPREHLLSFEEIARIVAVFASMGVRKVRLTGGEPTVRSGLEDLVSQLSSIEGIEDLAMTTNGHLFARRAEAFALAGLDRINVSIDSVDPVQFRELTRGGELQRVLDAIEAARRARLRPVKLNCVVIRGTNDDQITAMVEAFADRPDVVVRFIEFMPFSAVQRRRQHLPAAQMRARLEARYTLSPLGQRAGGGPAIEWRLEETGQRVGFISPITEHFCHACDRLRLQADGHLRTCLSREAAPSLREILRGGASDAELAQHLRERLWAKVAGHEAHLDGGSRAFEGAMTSVGG